MKTATLEAKLSQMTFKIMHSSLDLYERLNIPVISTARPFSFYRSVFYDGAPATQVLNEIRSQTLIDIGCGLTPFAQDSMFQECRRQGIDFYGVDPKVKDGFKFGLLDRLKSWGTGARSAPNPHLGGQDKAIACYANNLPFEDSSVDTILSAWLIFSWIRSDHLLSGIFTEFDRVLKPGGTIRLYPTPHWSSVLDSNSGLKAVIGHYPSQQRFIMGPNLTSEPPAFTTKLTKPDTTTS